MATRRDRIVEAMGRRWQRDLDRLHELFGPYDEDDFSDGAEIQRNLGTAIFYTCGPRVAPPQTKEERDDHIPRD